MWRAHTSLSECRRFQLLATLALLAALVTLNFASTTGASLPSRSLLLSDNQASATANYVFSFDIPAPQVIGSLKFQICANSPLLSDPCTAPSGFDISAAALSGQSGETGFVVLPAGTTSNTVVLTRVPTMSSATSVSYTFTGVANPSATGAYYGRLQTFTTADASGSDTDHGGLAYDIDGVVQVQTTVPPYLLFCSGVAITGFDCGTVSGNYVNFGNLNSTATASAESQMLTATNALNGYNIHVYGTTMTSGNNVINALPVADVSRPGTSQFGLNLVANVTPSVGQDPVGPGFASPTVGYNQQDFYKFSSGDLIASTPTVDDFRKLTASYIINIQKDQPIGVYVSTLTYVCLANF